jgi:MFS family permease
MWDRVAPGFGVVFAVFFVLGFLLTGDSPGLDDSPEEIATYFDEERGKLLTVIVLFGLAIVAFLWFLGSVVHTLRVEADESRIAPTALGAGVVTASLFGGIVLLNAGLAFQIAEDGDAGVVAAVYDLAWVASTLISFPVAALVFATGIGVWRSRLLPAWFGWASAVAAVAILSSGTTWARDGFWAPDGLYNAYITPIIFIAWTVVASVLLLLRRPVVAKETAKSTPKPG